MKTSTLKKLCALSLCLATFSGVLASCGGESGTAAAETTAAGNAETTAVETTAAEPKEPSAYDYIEKTDYDGYEFRIIAPTTSTRFFPSTLVPTETTGEIIYDTAFERNQIVEEYLNIKMVYCDGKDRNNCIPIANQSILAGDDSYDIVYHAPMYICQAASGNIFIDANTIDSLKFDMPWYNKNVNDNLTINGKLPTFASDFECTLLATTYAIFFNQDLATKYNIPSLYEVALDGLWTHDTMMKYMENINSDINGDGTMDKQDQYGYGLPYAFNAVCENPVMHQYGMGQMTAIINEDGQPELLLNTERAAQVMEKIYQLYHQVNYYPVGEVGFPVFTEGRELFLNCIIMHAHNYMREMEDNYGVLPMPKFDESQDEYYTSVSPGSAMLMGIPITVSDPERTGTIIDLLSYEGNQIHIPAFFETALKQKYARDTISAQVFDILRDGTIIDFGLAFDSGIGMSTISSKVAYNADNTFASDYAALQSSAMAKYTEIINAFNAK